MIFFRNSVKYLYLKLLIYTGEPNDGSASQTLLLTLNIIIVSNVVQDSLE